MIFNKMSLSFQVKIWFQNRRMKMKKMAERDKQEKEQMEREKQAMNIKLLSTVHQELKTESDS